MRILLLVEGVSTSTNAVAQVAEAIADAGANVTVATVRAIPEITERLSEIDVDHISLDAISGRDYPRATFRLSRSLQDREIDVLHCVEPIAATVGTAASLLSRRGKRLFDRQHSDAGWQQAVLSKFASRCAHVVRVPSQAARDWAVRQDGVARERVRVVYNAAATPREVDPQEVSDLRDALGLTARCDVVCTVARLRKGKGIETGMEALSLLRGQHERSVHYVVVGDGPIGDELRARAAKDPFVHFVGQQDDVALWHALADVVWMPSENESFGIAAVEAMASSRAIVASAVGGLREVVVDGETGLLIRPRDSSALAIATADLLADTPRRQALGRAARKRFLEHFTLEAFANGLVGCYSELIT